MAPEGRPPPGRGAGIPAERRTGAEGEELSVRARRPSKAAFRRAFQGVRGWTVDRGENGGRLRW